MGGWCGRLRGGGVGAVGVGGGGWGGVGGVQGGFIYEWAGWGVLG